MSEIPGHEPLDYEAFLVQEHREAEYAQHLEVETMRLTYLLADAGVDFQYKQDVREAPWLAGTGEAAEAHESSADINLRYVNYLATLTLEYGPGGLDVEHAPADLKKTVQATFLAAGCDGPWQELIDKEFPGEPLDELQDWNYVFTARAEYDERSRQAQATFVQARDAFMEFFGDDEVGGLAADAHQLLVEDLADMHSRLTMNPAFADSSAWQEEARAYLMACEIPLTPGLQRIIAYTADASA